MARVEDQVLEYWERGTDEERIHHLRRIILVHSILYYRFNTSVIADHVFDEWTYELARIQRENPLAMVRVLYHKESFLFFAGADAYALPLYDRRATNRAIQIMRKRDKPTPWP
jgi:hypothetical protein